MSGGGERSTGARQNMLPATCRHDTAAALPFDRKYHARNNPAASKHDTIDPCSVCGWARHMAIHDAPNIKTNFGWAHEYQP